MTPALRPEPRTPAWEVLIMQGLGDPVTRVQRSRRSNQCRGVGGSAEGPGEGGVG